MAPARNYFAWQRRLVMREVGARVVEVGCGIGNFTGMLLEQCAVMALDLEPECIAELTARYAGAANLEAIAADWGAADWEYRLLPRLRAFRPDSCVCLNVLEHIENDLDALRRMASILDPGGVIVLLVPAFPMLYGPIDRHLGHCRRYTRASVRKLAAGAGLEIKSLRYMNAVGLFGWWVNAHVFKREWQSAGQIVLFDRFVVPVLSRLEGAAAPPFGQSLLVVMRKSKVLTGG